MLLAVFWVLMFFYSTVLVEAVRPNIVFIIADDLGWSDVGFHSGDVRTPNLDALAYHGTIFGRHYSQPLCTPSRAALLTGDYPIRFGMQGEPCYAGVADSLPLNVKLMPEYFRELGYKTHLVGKWHLGYETPAHLPTRRGFDTFFGYLNGYLGYWDGTHYYNGRAARDVWRGEKGAWQEVYGRYLTEVLTEEVVKVIEEHDPEESMFLIFGENAVHASQLSIEKEAPMFIANHTKRGILREMAVWLDWSIGQVVAALDRKNVLNNTIIVFISDNGALSDGNGTINYGSNWPYRGQKYSVHEGGVKTASVIYSQLLPIHGRVTEQIFHITDWLPTLFNAAGGDPMKLEHNDGLNQWESLLSGGVGPRQEVLVNIDERSGAEGYINEKWKLVRNYNKGTEKADHYFGVSPNWMEYDFESVKNSTVAHVVGGIPSNWEELKTKVTTRERCSKTTEAENNDCHSKYCLFDLLMDPTECQDVAENNPSVVTELQSKLDYYRTFLVPQPHKTFDKRSDPSKRNDYWGPWLH